MRSPTSLSSREIRSLRSSTFLAIFEAASRTLSSSALRSVSDWRFVSCSAASLVRASARRAVSAFSLSPSVRMLPITRARSLSCSARASACSRMAGNAEASSMALRTMSSASSLCVIITGGGFRPMRCIAARSAAMLSWRCSSVPRRWRSWASSSPSRDSIRLSWASLE